jgi:hypothetical protein
MKRQTNQAQIERKGKPHRQAAQFNTTQLLQENPTMQHWGDDELFFFAESIRAARKLPMEDGITFLRGLLKVCEDREQMRQLRAVVIAMDTANYQLDVLQVGVDPFAAKQSNQRGVDRDET